MRRNRRGFTLLETVIALAILALALMAIFDLNSGAVANHVYSKHLTIASLLARSKMTDLEQKLYDDGFSSDDDEESGDFSQEGWPNFKWRAKIIAPKLNGLSPDQVIGAIFNLPIGGEGGDLAGLADMFGGSAGGKDSGGGPVPTGGGMAGMAAGMMQPMMTQMVDQLTQTVREVHLTVTWKQGKVVESMDVVTHVVSLGPGSDRNGGGTFNAGTGAPTPGASGTWVDVETGMVVQNVVPGPNGQMVDAATQRPVMDRQAWLNQRNNPGGGIGAPFRPGGNKANQ
jgi:general secretion pathway protein I